MGMGEPLDNYANVLKAAEIMSSDIGLAFSGRKITLSTCGLAPMIQKLGQDACVNLAVSLNAADDETRSVLMPINKKYPIGTLIDACKGYEMPARRRITFEYILIEGGERIREGCGKTRAASARGALQDQSDRLQ